MDYRNIVLQWGMSNEEIAFEKVCHGTQIEAGANDRNASFANSL
jgi:hypothetical protein